MSAHVADIESRIVEADAAHARAVDEFEHAPTPKSHSAVAVAEQIAKNLRAELKHACAEVADAERAEQRAKLDAAITRAQPVALYARVESPMARIRELHAELAALTGEIVAACAEQNRATRDAQEIARELGVSAPIPRRIAATFIRAIIGIRVARDVYAGGVKFTLGQEPHTFVQPRPEVPSAHPGRDEWRAARALALPAGEFLPPPMFDHHRDLADAPQFYHHHLTHGRPERHEVA